MLFILKIDFASLWSPELFFFPGQQLVIISLFCFNDFNLNCGVPQWPDFFTLYVSLFIMLSSTIFPLSMDVPMIPSSIFL